MNQGRLIAILTLAPLSGLLASCQAAAGQAPGVADAIVAVLNIPQRVPREGTFVVIDQRQLGSIGGMRSEEITGLSRRLPQNVAVGIPAVGETCAGRPALECFALILGSFLAEGDSAVIRLDWHIVTGCADSHGASYVVRRDSAGSPTVDRTFDEDRGSCGVRPP